MYPENKQNKKKKERNILLIIILILLLISLCISLIYIFQNKDDIFAENSLLKIKEFSTEEKQSYIEEYEGDYTELVGYGKVTITSKRPYLYLENVKDNQVYLQFDVYNSNELIYSSQLIQPGDFDSLNVYELLPKGEYVLTYKVTTFDINTQAELLSLMQEQEINIIGG